MAARDGVEEARDEVAMSTGKITLAFGKADPLFSCRFRTHVAAWAPEVPETRNIPEAGARNEGELTLSPEVLKKMSITVDTDQGERTSAV